MALAWLTALTLSAQTAFVDLSGGLAGWTTVGQVSTQSGAVGFTFPGGTAFGYTPAFGQNVALIEPWLDPPNPVFGPTAATTAMGLSSGTIEGLVGTMPTDFGILQRNYSFTAGVTYSFAWAYASNDTAPYNDGALFAVAGGSSQTVISLARTGASLTDTSGPSPGTVVVGGLAIATPWATATFAVPSTGSYLVSFAAYNWGDSEVSPTLVIAQSPGTYTGQPFGGPAFTNIDSSQPYYPASNLGTSVNPIFTGGTLRLDNTNATYAQDFALAPSPTNTIDQSGRTATFSGVFADAGGASGPLTIANSGSGGAVILTGANTYTGGTSINGGATLQLGNGGTTGSIVGDVTVNGALVFNHSEALTFAGPISGTGSLTQAGTGPLTLTGANTYTGGTTINPGATLQVGNGGASGSLLGGVWNDGALIFNLSGDLTFASNIDGHGSLTQSGLGTLTFTAFNTYLGGTTINAGATLQLSEHGNISGNVNNNGVLVFNHNGPPMVAHSDVLIYRDVVSGAGRLVQAGTQMLTLTGANTYTGGTTIQTGATLQLGGGGTTGSIVGDVTDNGTLIVNRSAALNLAGNISGSGSLLQSGPGLLTLTGANTYAGGTTINPGAALQVGNGGTTGGIAGDVANSGMLIFNRSNSATFAGVVSGPGSLTQAGPGTLTLAGINTYTGGTTLAQGTVAIGADANLGAATGTLVITGGTLALTGNVATTRPFVVGAAGGTLDTGTAQLAMGGFLTGTGSLRKAGAGSWNLTGPSTGYTGALQVAQGTLYANTTLGAATVTVAAPATLRGTGTLLGAVSVAGKLSPGNSPGTLSVGGPVTFAPGSTAAFDIDGPGTGAGAGNYSRLVSGSSITLNGGTLAPVLRGITGAASNSFTPVRGQTFRLLSAVGGISGSFSGLSQPDGLPAGLIFDTVYGASTLDVVAVPADFGQLGALGIGPTPNRLSTGAALQGLRPAPGTRGANSDFFINLYTLDVSDLTSAFDQIGTAVYGQILEGGLQAVREVGLVPRRAGHGAEPFWLDTSGFQVRVTGDGWVQGFESRGAVGLVGCDLWRRPSALAGVAIGHLESRLVSSGPDHARATATAQHLVGYGRLDRGPWRLDWDASVGLFRASLKRTVAFGTYAADLQSKPRLTAADWSVDFSRAVNLGAVDLRPGVLVQAGTAWMGGFDEQGAAPVALRHHTGTVSRLAGGASVEAARNLHLGRRALELGLRVAYLGEACRKGAANEFSLAGSTAPALTLRGQRPRAGFAQTRAHAALEVFRRADAYLALENNALGSEGQGYNLSGGLHVHW